MRLLDSGGNFLNVFFDEANAAGRLARAPVAETAEGRKLAEVRGGGDDNSYGETA